MSTEQVHDETQDDDKVRRTDNGWREGDGSQPVQTVPPEDESDAGRKLSGQVAAVLKIAASQIGTVERSDGSNPYGAYYGMDRVAWCAEFVWWVFNHAGVGSLICKSAYTPTFFQWFEGRGQAPNDLQPGDVIFFDWERGGFVNPGQEGRIDHVGIVEAVLGGGMIQTIEGNTTPPTGVGNQGMGGGVWRRQRSMSYVAGWGRPKYSTAPTPAPAPPKFDPNTLATLSYGMQGNAHVALFQKASNAYPWKPELPILPPTGNYGPMTQDVVRRAAAQCGVPTDGKVIGPTVKAGFAARGIRW